MSDKKLMSVDTINGVTCIAFRGPDLVDGAEIATVGQQMTNLVEGLEAPRVLVNFKAIEHLSSAAISVLIRMHKVVLEAGGQLRLANVSPAIQELFAITNLDKIFQIDETARESLEKFDAAGA